MTSLQIDDLYPDDLEGVWGGEPVELRMEPGGDLFRLPPNPNVHIWYEPKTIGDFYNCKGAGGCGATLLRSGGKSNWLDEPGCNVMKSTWLDETRPFDRTLSIEIKVP